MMAGSAVARDIKSSDGGRRYYSRQCYPVMAGNAVACGVFTRDDVVHDAIARGVIARGVVACDVVVQ